MRGKDKNRWRALFDSSSEPTGKGPFEIHLYHETCDIRCASYWHISRHGICTMGLLVGDKEAWSEDWKGGDSGARIPASTNQAVKHWAI